MNNLIELFYNVLFNPSETFKTFTCEKTYKLPVFILLLASLFLLILSENHFNYGTLLIFMSKFANLIIYWLFFAFFVDLISKIFNNDSKIERLLALTSLAYIPWIFLAPLKLLKNSQFSVVATILILGVWLWTIILQVLAISEAYNISRKNAIIILLIPFLATILYFIWCTDFFVKLFQISVL